MYQRLLYGHRRAVRNLKARLRRTKARWSNVDCFDKRRDLECLMDYLEREIDMHSDRIAMYKQCV
jgi:hypothetical protein